MAGTTREEIVSEADGLFYQQGFEHTSFADIAAAVGISRGNFYYHFKSKDEILSAVIELRLANTHAMLERWDREGGDPTVRIRCFIRILIANRAKIIRHGCPVGTLTGELAKLAHPSLSDAARLFTLFRDWLARQFMLMGRAQDEADEFALHLLARSQGVATLANAFGDTDFSDTGFAGTEFVEREVAGMCAWLDRIAAGN
ncbi:TetR/AcrR family transcriptional regulator [Stappia sp.]|uniref:TetR/AcrR family transcriptional regulator n=1 Tax=Stappia sp. TaxID=1870903 RepID=UPI003D11E935